MKTILILRINMKAYESWNYNIRYYVYAVLYRSKNKIVLHAMSAPTIILYTRFYNYYNIITIVL